jgi:hypothetical protein
MTLDNDTLRPRRAVLVAALGGLAASAMAAVARPDVVRAGSDGDVVLGATNSSTHGTFIESTGIYGLGCSANDYGMTAYGSTTAGIKGESNQGYGVYGVSQQSYGVYGLSLAHAGVYGESNSGTGVVGRSESAIGVSGTSPTGTGVSGASGSAIGVAAFSNATAKPAGRGWSAGESTGLQGHSGSDSPPAAPAKTGVFGYAAQDADARGVHGQSASGRGVYGQATTGHGVRGYATTGSAVYGATSSAKSGYALRTVGRVRFEKSVGIATVAAGSNHVTVSPGIDITTTTAVVATLQGSAGGKTTVHRVAVSTSADTFTIYLTANATASVKVAWHVFG